MFYEEVRIKQDLSYISISSLSILYNSKFILMETSLCLGTNAVVVTRVHCNFPTDRSKADPLSGSLRVGGSINGVCFVIICHYLFLISSSFGASGRLCFVIPSRKHAYIILTP